MSIFDFDSLSNLFVRPTRQVYKNSDLGRPQIKISNMRFYRSDFRLPTSKEGYLQCSIFSKFQKHFLHNIDKCIVYLHCNTGCRIQGLPYLKYLLPEGYAVFLFDFTGSGLSTGEYITLGFNETYDIKIVINYLKKINRSMKIGLWGRSMGAVAAIRYCSSNSDALIAILDSPFSSLLQLALDLGNKRTYLPNFILEIFYKFLNPTIKQKVGIGLYQIDNKQIINKVRIPIIFLTSKNDSVVSWSQVQLLFDNFKGQKQLIFIEKDHNQLRDSQTIKSIIKYMKKIFADQSYQMQYDSNPNYHRNLKYQQNFGNRISLTNWKNEDKISVRTIKSRYTIQTQTMNHMNNGYQISPYMNYSNHNSNMSPNINMKRR